MAALSEHGQYELNFDAEILELFAADYATSRKQLLKSSGSIKHLTTLEPHTAVASAVYQNTCETGDQRKTIIASTAGHTVPSCGC